MYGKWKMKSDNQNEYERTRAACAWRTRSPSRASPTPTSSSRAWPIIRPAAGKQTIYNDYWDDYPIAAVFRKIFFI